MHEICHKLYLYYLCFSEHLFTVRVYHWGWGNWRPEYFKLKGVLSINSAISFLPTTAVQPPLSNLAFSLPENILADPIVFQVLFRYSKRLFFFLRFFKSPIKSKPNCNFPPPNKNFSSLLKPVVNADSGKYDGELILACSFSTCSPFL